MKPRLALLAALVLALLLAPASEAEKDPGLEWSLHERCVLERSGPPGPEGNKLVIVTTGTIIIERDRRLIKVVEYQREDCRGGQPTVDNIDRIVLKGLTDVFVDARAGRFGPGATPEPGGSEIEIRTYGPRITYYGSRRSDRIVITTLRGGRPGLDLNAPRIRGRGDVDLIVNGPPRNLRISAKPGRDLIDARRLTSFDGERHRLFLRGQAGNDVILGSDDAEWRIEDGRGRDFVRAGGGADDVWIGRGHDVVYGDEGADDIRYAVYQHHEATFGDVSDRFFGGRGNDRLEDRNGKRDVLSCGPGHDWVRQESRDRFGPGCEERFGRLPGGPGTD